MGTFTHISDQTVRNGMNSLRDYFDMVMDDIMLSRSGGLENGTYCTQEMAEDQKIIDCAGVHLTRLDYGIPDPGLVGLD